MKTLALFLGLVSAAASAGAAPIRYDISFTPDFGFPIPSSGSFYYDASIPVFTNFFVAWNGVTFDLTTSANTATLTGLCDTPGPSAADAFAFLTTPACGGGAWLVTQSGSPFAVLRLAFKDPLSGPPVGPEVMRAEVDTGVGRSRIFNNGEFSVSESVPEPTTVGLVLSGAVLLTWKRRRRSK